MVKKIYIKHVAPSKDGEKWFDFFDFAVHNCTDKELNKYYKLIDDYYTYEQKLADKYNIDYSIFENDYLI